MMERSSSMRFSMGGAGEDEGVAAAEAFYGLGGLGGPVFDALGFVEDDDVGAETFVDIEAVGDDLLVVGYGEKGRLGLGVGAEAGGAVAVNEAEGEVGEAADLLLPLGLQGGGGDDEHAGGATEVVQEGAGGDGLDGFAEAHLVGEEGAFGEGEVEHALALVGEKWILGDVFGVAAVDDAGFVVAAEEAAFAGAAAGFEPGGDFLGYAEVGRGVAGDGGEGVVGGDVGVEEAGGIEEDAEAGGEAVVVALDAEGAGGGVGDEVDARRAGGAGGEEGGFFAAGEVEEDGLDVFAGAESVDAEVGAGAGEMPGGEVADFDVVGEAAGGVDGEVGEDGVGGVRFSTRGLSSLARRRRLSISCSSVVRQSVAGGIWLTADFLARRPAGMRARADEMRV
jgi:hypothetical protein